VTVILVVAAGIQIALLRKKRKDKKREQYAGELLAKAADVSYWHLCVETNYVLFVIDIDCKTEFYWAKARRVYYWLHIVTD
jgi:hypothetical protein